MRSDDFDALVASVLRAQREGRLPTTPTREQRISWVYGESQLSGAGLTREQCASIVDDIDRRRAAAEELTALTQDPGGDLEF